MIYHLTLLVLNSSTKQGSPNGKYMRISLVIPPSYIPSQLGRHVWRWGCRGAGWCRSRGWNSGELYNSGFTPGEGDTFQSQWKKQVMDFLGFLDVSAKIQLFIIIYHQLFILKQFIICQPWPCPSRHVRFGASVKVSVMPWPRRDTRRGRIRSP